MKFVKFFALYIAIIVICILVPGCSELDITVFDDGELSVTPDPSKYINVSLEDKGLCIFNSGEIGGGYRYGPSLITNNDGSIDAWFAGPGGNDQWDWIYYRRSSDGGLSWSQEQVVLTGTRGSWDGLSVCDPGVIKIGEYYYLGYTSTLKSDALSNNVFVARSKNPNGPFEKWDGTGWSDNAYPIVYYDEDPSFFGCGEPSFVVKDNVLYIYVNWVGASGNFTKVYTADANSENWPSTMEYRGNAVNKTGDSMDVKYVEDFGKFIGVCVSDRMSENSKLTFYQSDDGFSFRQCTEISENTGAGSHNAGISSRPNGHIRLKDKVYLGYAYGSAWADWDTRLHIVKMKLGDKLYSELDSKGVNFEDKSTYVAGKEDLICGVSGSEVRVMAGDTRTSICYKIDKNGSAVNFTSDDVKEAKYTISDTSVAKVNADTGEISGLKAGKTYLTVTLEDFNCSMAVIVFENSVDYYGQRKEPVSFKPTASNEYCLSLSEGVPKQIRGILYYSDGTFEEISDVRFKVVDSSVCHVDKQGFLRPRSVGETEVKVSYGDLGNFKVKVTVFD